jgi:hypothetical protein
VAVGFDRTDDGDDSAVDRPAHPLSRPDGGGDARQIDGLAEADPLGAEAAAPGSRLTAEERVANYRQAQESAAAVYAEWDRQSTAVKDETAHHAPVPGADGERQRRDRDDASGEHPGKGPAADGDARGPGSGARPSDAEALRRCTGELQAERAASARLVAALEAKVAEQDSIIAQQGETIDVLNKGLAALKAEVGRIASRLEELDGKQGEPKASANIERRFRSSDAQPEEWEEEQPRRRLPTDAVNNVISAVAGTAIVALPYQVHDLPPEVAGIAAGGVTLGAGIIAVWRERRKAKDDDGHRPEN